jgi:acetyl-CoA carboxylase biotin carboxylase subunit
MTDTVLIANRGEISVRIARACRALGLSSVAVFSEADRGAMFTKVADEAVCIGPAPAKHSYLNVAAIVSAAQVTGASWIHPGYGFLSESAEFAALLEQLNLGFIGPRPETMHTWGHKLRSRHEAQKHGLTVLPGSEPLSNVEHAFTEAERIGYPLMLKATSGGGGRGLRVVRNQRELERGFTDTLKEMAIGFGASQLYLEKLLDEPKHIELQVLGDGTGNVWIFGDRECSLQRRHQKLIEEAPSPTLTDSQRDELLPRAIAAMKATRYLCLGTLEFLRSADGQLFFVEMNTRLQVEHPVTELVFGIDLVQLQIRAALGLPLGLPERPVWRPRGHAMECRVNAEDPWRMFPSSGTVDRCSWPGGPGIRVDTGIATGSVVPPDYDSMLAKVIAFGCNRDEAILRMRGALLETRVEGVRTNVDLHLALLADAEVLRGTMTTQTLARVMKSSQGSAAELAPSSAVAQL